MDVLDSLAVRCVDLVAVSWLAGSRTAHRIGMGPIYISPAMLSLVRDVADDGDELARLLQAIPLRHWPPGLALEAVRAEVAR